MASAGRDARFEVPTTTYSNAKCAFMATTMGVLSAVTACAVKPEPQWTAPPRLHWADIATQPVPPLCDNYVILTGGRTTGQFPASIAVTRLSADPDAAENAPSRTHIASTPHNEFLQWNSAFDDQMAVSEVFPIAQRDLGGAPAVPDQVVAAFHALHGTLGMIYAVNELSPTESEIIGVIYAPESGRLLAAVHAHAESVPPAENQKETDVDPWESDARALVRQKFQRLVHSCIRELINQDEPQMVETPEGWTPAGPRLPVEWPPRRYPRRRFDRR